MSRFAIRDDDPLFARAFRAAGWSFVNTAVSRLGTLAIGIALARILGPQEFGTFAVAMVALLAILSFNELGVSLAIVRWPGDPKEVAPTVATISVVTSVAMYVVCYLGAPAFAAAMGAPDAAGVVRVLTFNVVINGVVAAPVALVQRAFRQDRKMIADQVNNWLGTAVSIALALAGMGAMSLAVGRLVGALTSGVLYVRFSPEPLRLGFDAGVARRLLRFGLPLAGSSMVMFAAGSVDQFVVGKVLGATALGFYVLAFNLSSWPVQMFSQPVRGVAPAAFARLQGDLPAMRRTFLSTAGLLAGLTLPVCLLLSGSAQPLIHFVYGASWSTAAHGLVWLALLGAFRILFELMYDYFVVLARTRAVFTIQLLWLIALVPALVVGARLGGIAGVGVAHILVAVVLVLPLYLWELHRHGIRLAAVTRGLGLPVLVAAGVGAVATLAHRVIPFDLLALALAGVVAVAAVAALLYRMRGVFADLKAMEQPDAGTS
ncbi:oligosaccharide flippase family protein [Actinopolymorpha sp. NPDC004070]|uniref:oligosaccharide flippase family protein n=1 Tax=Actinopolymorpha sp. NPDC004070 TaxID=3154548 RepID=UPI0033A2390B